MEPEEEEEAMEVVTRVSELGHHTWPIDLDSNEDDEMVAQLEDKNKAKGTHRSNCLHGHWG